mmetsp:Transcript_131015/g.195249  ORF Transcript_131015/g.195249 Transcript_131015/m.195249 type:complete len:554 (-) Transcript_131015:96-1757(-)|eukprot:CAMPEP_0117005144 /NCGR_PEP_ID=MMETSP0472-20121206/5872_1 /TAXON_ID=693140 ORGANISM="Tiarina fusus, Strain LIS" /NCGR_SAMPLE_ID=MMETSP0472 /ASSEMBLY_ACC=CAM_ASM_000603 /LENGTH=553 /DNA_ID=CAMNT_0004706315 /DNA_START=143 /DNA_END=1804 /DNA_ORIENTATION=-
MASAVHTTDILSSAFFNLFDQLEEDAASLEASTEALTRAKTTRDETQVKLRNVKKQLGKTRAIIKEQKDRIRLVSSHWFYGNILFQPQLWLRGGCQGKIHRATAKLEKAEEHDLPELLAEITSLQEVVLPRAQASVDEHLARFDLSANAASGRQVMRERVFAEYPSQKLLQLQQSEESLERRATNTVREIQNLNEVMPKLDEGQKCYQKSRNLLEESLRLNEKFQQIQASPITTTSPVEVLRSRNHRARSETRVPNGTRIISIDQNNGEKDIIHVDRRGNILTTNFPCPSQCGFLITKYGTHCCNACSHGSGHHGPRCERKVVGSQQCAQTKLHNLQLRQQAHQSELSRENENCNKAYASARQEAKQGERVVRQALSSIAVSIRERYTVVCNGLHARMATPSSPGGCPCAKVRATHIRKELSEVEEAQLVLTEQVSAMEQLQAQIRQDGEDVQHQLQSTRSIMEVEQSRIFLELRERVLLGGNPTSSAGLGQSASGLVDETASYDRPPAFAPHDPGSISIPSAPVEGEVVSPIFSADQPDHVPMVAATLVVDA